MKARMSLHSTGFERVHSAFTTGNGSRTLIADKLEKSFLAAGARVRLEAAGYIQPSSYFSAGEFPSTKPTIQA